MGQLHRADSEGVGPAFREGWVHIREAARVLRINPGSIRRWESEGLIVCERDEFGNRIFKVEDLWPMYHRCYGRGARNRK